VADSCNMLVPAPECLNQSSAVWISSQVDLWSAPSNKENSSIVVCIDFNQGFGGNLLSQNFLVSLEF